jgi:gas vesicle protein
MSKENGNGLKGITLGLIIGAGAALLLSPEAGKENREKLKKNLLKASDKLKDLAENIKIEENVNYINVDNENISKDGKVYVNEKYIDNIDLD